MHDRLTGASFEVSAGGVQRDTIFVAWTQQRQDLADPGQLRIGRDFGRVFTGPADNVFMIKATRWIGR